MSKVAQSAAGAYENDWHNDQTLAVDGLNDLFPAQTAEIDSTLTVGTLSGLFPAREVDPMLAVGPLEDMFPERDDHAADDSFTGYFSGAEGASTTAVAPSEEPAATPVADEIEVFEMRGLKPAATPVGEEVEVVEMPDLKPLATLVDDQRSEMHGLFASNQGIESGQIVQSDIQRAALDFERFAEKFHAFASECQQRVTHAGIDPARPRL
jgi:hypothetical protein